MKLVKEHINFERGLDPKEAMQTGFIYSRVPDIKSFFKNIHKFNRAEPCEFPWNCYFLKENNGIIGLCYMFGERKWDIAYFNNLNNIIESEKAPNDIMVFSKDFWLFLIKNGIYVDEFNLNRYDQKVLKRKY
jgi:hypothetical protein